MGPLISVILLTLNSEKYICRAFKSLERQTFDNFEAIVVDAGSIDKTKQIVQSFDSRFKFLSCHNSDMGMARNFGIANSKSTIITFLDSDDFYLDNKLERQYSILSVDQNISISYCAAWHFRTDKPSLIGHKSLDNIPLTLRDFISGKNFNLNTMCFRKNIWEMGFKFGEGDRGRYGEEWRLQLSMALAGISMNFIDELLVVAEMRPDSHTLWSRQWIMKEQAIQELELVSKNLNSQKNTSLNLKFLIDYFRYKLIISLIIDEKKFKAIESSKLINSNIIRYKSYFFIVLTSILPSKFLAQFLKILWIKRQNNSFIWVKTPDFILKLI